MSRLVNSTRGLAEVTLPQVMTVDDMNVQRVDVQQYFTDVAATRERRAYEGARQAAEGFLANVAKYRSAFERDGNVVGLERLARVESEFRRFDAAGRDMAETYLLQGTEAGNLKMQQFDAASAVIARTLGDFRAEQLAAAESRAAATLGEAQAASGYWLHAASALLC